MTSHEKVHGANVTIVITREKTVVTASRLNGHPLTARQIRQIEAHYQIPPSAVYASGRWLTKGGDPVYYSSWSHR